jgi:hypothetical protein
MLGRTPVPLLLPGFARPRNGSDPPANRTRPESTPSSTVSAVHALGQVAPPHAGLTAPPVSKTFPTHWFPGADVSNPVTGP